MISELVMKYIAPEDRDSATVDTKARIAECLNARCVQKRFYVNEEFKSKQVSCPHCNTKYKVKCYKNGSIQIVRLCK